MTKLSFIESEARRHVGKMAELKLDALQKNLIKACESHWSAIRGPEPLPGLARVLWAITPHYSDLVVDWYGGSVSESEFSEALFHLPPTQVLAAVVLAEIGHSDAEGARLAHEAMMLFETPRAREVHTDAVRSRLRGARPDRGKWRKHVNHDPFFRAIVMISEETGRFDLQAIVAAVEYLSTIQADPAAMGDDQEAIKILEFLRKLDLVFRGLEEGRIHYTLRGVAKKPVSGKRLEEILAEIRGNL